MKKFHRPIKGLWNFSARSMVPRETDLGSRCGETDTKAPGAEPWAVFHQHLLINLWRMWITLVYQ